MKSNAPFCCEEHQEQHKSEAMSRLMEYREAKPAPHAEEDLLHRFAVMSVGPREESISTKWELQPLRALEARRYAPMRRPFSEFFDLPGPLEPRLRWAPAPEPLVLWSPNIRPVIPARPAPSPAQKKRPSQAPAPVPLGQPLYTLSELFQIESSAPHPGAAPAAARLSPNVSIIYSHWKPALGATRLRAWLPTPSVDGWQWLSCAQSWMDPAGPMMPRAGTAMGPANPAHMELPVFPSRLVALPSVPHGGGLPGSGLAAVRPAFALAPLSASAAAAGSGPPAAGQIAFCSPVPMVWGVEPAGFDCLAFAAARKQTASFQQPEVQWRDCGAPPWRLPVFELRRGRSTDGLEQPRLPRARDLGSLRPRPARQAAPRASLRLPDPELLVPAFKMSPLSREPVGKSIAFPLVASQPAKATPLDANTSPHALASRGRGATAAPLTGLLSPRFPALQSWNFAPQILETSQALRGEPASISGSLPARWAGAGRMSLVETLAAPRFPNPELLRFGSEALPPPAHAFVMETRDPAGISRFGSGRNLAQAQGCPPRESATVRMPAPSERVSFAEGIYGPATKILLPAGQIATRRVQPQYGRRLGAEARAAETPAAEAPMHFADAAGYILVSPSARFAEKSAGVEGLLAAWNPPFAAHMPARSGAATLAIAARIAPIETMAPAEARWAEAPGHSASTANEAPPVMAFSAGASWEPPKRRSLLPPPVLSPVLTPAKIWPMARELPPAAQAPCGLRPPGGLANSGGPLPAPAAPSSPRPKAPRAAADLRETAFGPAVVRTPPAADPVTAPRPPRPPVPPVPVPIAPVDLDATDDPFETVAPRPAPAVPTPPPAAAPSDALREAVERAQQSRAGRVSRLVERASTVWHSLLQPALETRRGRIAVRAAAAMLILGVTLYLLRSPLKSAMASAFRPLSERAYFLLEEDFRSGLSAWTAQDMMSRRDDGLMQLKQGLTLYRGSLNRMDYEFTFSGLIWDDAIGWAVRAADAQNYYAFKLTWQGKGKEQRGVLTRYAVVGGTPLEKPQVVALPFDLAKNKLYQVTVDVAGDRITTMIDGRGVDSCSNPKLQAGGVGFFAEAGEAGAVHSVSISGNDDGTGRFLQWLKGFYQFLTNNR